MWTTQHILGAGYTWQKPINSLGFNTYFEFRQARSLQHLR